MIDTWQEAFGGPRARYPQYYVAYQELLILGVPEKAEKDEIVKVALVLKNLEMEDGYTTDLIMSHQDF